MLRARIPFFDHGQAVSDQGKTVGKILGVWMIAAALGAVVGEAQSGDINPHGELTVGCADCHSVEGWKPLRQPLMFDHETTRFTLDGAHAAGIACVSCHADLVFERAPSDCFSCHESDFRGATEPSHETFSTSCQTCHATAGWSPANFDHMSTGFPLLGAHQGVDCASCHASGSAANYAGMPTDCFSCHVSDFDSAAEPSHEGFSTACTECHRMTGWQPASFDHSATGFVLVGAHRVVDCASCHASGYAGTPTDCFACHESDFSAAVDPRHDGFPTTCESCHSLSGWSPASFDHNITGFPLVGAHRAVDCASCHADGFSGTPTDCIACHQSDFQGAREPDHNGFPTTCESCHSLSGWSPADFNHNQTAFPLTGSHRDVGCQSCHAGGYSGTPLDCFSCHSDDYSATNSPDHAAAGFPITCQACHDTGDWNDANWDHDDRFPINSGEHRRAWSTCEDCHTSGGNYRIFSCTVCHEHERSEMDDEHDDVGGYRYESRACFSCHPDGEE